MRPYMLWLTVRYACDTTHNPLQQRVWNAALDDWINYIHRLHFYVDAWRA